MLARLLILCVLATPTAHASIFDVYGFNARGIAMGGSMTSSVADYTGTYYNPAGISQNKQLIFGGGYMLTVPFLSVQRSEAVCQLGPDACAKAHPTGYSNRETVLPESFSGFTLGWVFPFGGALKKKWVNALAVYIPTINVIRVEALDPQTPQFYMYQNLPDELVILTSLAYEPVPWLSIGLGIQVLANVHGGADFDLDLINGQFDDLNFRVEISPQSSATAGILVKPLDQLRIGLSYRQAIGLEFELPAKLRASESLNLDLTVAGSVLYQPHQLNLGFTYQFDKPNLAVSAEVGYAMWSLAPDPSPDVRLNIGGTLIETFGLEDMMDISTDKSTESLNFIDTWTPRVGVEWQPLNWLQIRGGYYFRPSPAPKATGSANYLDNDLHSFSAGTAFIFADPFGVDRDPISVELATQLAWLPNRSVVKKEAGDPIGNLSHGGLTTMFAVSINHTY